MNIINKNNKYDNKQKKLKGSADDWGSSDCNQTVGGIRPRGWFQPTGIEMTIIYDYVDLHDVMMIMVISADGS